MLFDQIMGVFRTWLVGLLVFLSGAPVQATGSVHEDLHVIFATCAGQLSATMEHQWLLADPTSERTELHRAAMIGLLQATTPADQRSATLARRIEAKMAHAALLTRASFNTDQQDALWAQRQAEQTIASCTSLLLS